ncbi:Venom acid phosphatase Acph-1 [Eumeta japonica]|uniref:Venom acid phosphatase Acph-1 n=1 Tax=Eumeta variegata TaxID=151549 RepID=A0A4C1YZA2_EUMVA|nr:Venom acid phosphatase Acph-1 [Eumeta japonica]
MPKSRVIVRRAIHDTSANFGVSASSARSGRARRFGVESAKGCCGMVRARISARLVKMARWCGGACALLAAAWCCAVTARVIRAPAPPPAPLDPAVRRNTDLVLVHTISRHGIRTPADTFPKDSHINDTFYPFGWGSLTNDGRKQMYKMGQYLRSRYDKFLGSLYTEKATFAQATGAARARMSCELLLAGLWPPAGTALDWNPELNWQPIPVVTQELDDDSLLLVRRPCPRWDEAREEVVASEDAQAKLAEYATVLKELTEQTGKTIKEFEDVLDVYTTLQSEEATGVRLDDWVKDFFPEKLEPLAIESFMVNTYTDELIRLKGGLFLERLFSDWRAVIEGSKKQPARMSVFAGHDSTVANVARALGAWQPQVPDFATTLLVELRRDPNTQKYFVEIFQKNATSSEAVQLVIDGCKPSCPLEKVFSLRGHLVPTDWKNECKARDVTYTPPPQRGP